MILHDKHVKDYNILLELEDYYCDRDDGTESPWQKYKKDNYKTCNDPEIKYNEEGN